MNGQQVTQTLIQIAIALNRPTNSSQHKDAVQFIQQVKAGPVDVLAFASSQMVDIQQSLEVQLLGYQLLTHLVKFRWTDMPDEFKKEILQVAFKCFSQDTQYKIIKIKSCICLFWTSILCGPETAKGNLENIMSNALQDFSKLESCFVFLSVFNEEYTNMEDGGYQVEAKRKFLPTLKTILPKVMSCLLQVIYIIIKLNESGSMNEMNIKFGSPTYAMLLIEEAMKCIGFIFEWSPIDILHELVYKVKEDNLDMLEICLILLQSQEFRDYAVIIALKLLGHKLLKEFLDQYQDLMTTVAKIFYSSTLILEQKIKQNKSFSIYDQGVISNNIDSMFELEDQELDSFVNLVEEVLNAYDGQRYSNIKNQDLKISILVQVLKLSQSQYLPLSLQSLLFWQNIMRDQKYKLPNDCLVVLISILAKQFTIFSTVNDKVFTKKEKDFPLYFDSIVQFKDFIDGYRTSIKNLWRIISQRNPQVALQALSDNMKEVQTVVASVEASNQSNSNSSNNNNSSTLKQDQSLWYSNNVIIITEIMFSLQDSVIAQTVDDIIKDTIKKGNIKVDSSNQSQQMEMVKKYIMENDQESQYKIKVIEQILEDNFKLKINSPKVVLMLARALESFGPYLALVTHRMPLVLSNIFETMLGIQLPGISILRNPPLTEASMEYWEAHSARTKMAGIVSDYAKVASSSLLPLLQGLVEKVELLDQQNLITTSERYLFMEAVILAASPGGSILQEQAANWVLGPIKQRASEPQWRSKFSSPTNFLHNFLPINKDTQINGRQHTTLNENFTIEGRNERWELFHHLWMLEHGLRSIHSIVDQSKDNQHPLTLHLEWILEYLLVVLTQLHLLWDPKIQQSIQGEMQYISPTLQLSPEERSLFMQKKLTPPRKFSFKVRTDGQLSYEAQHGVSGITINSGRAFLRSCRETIYMALGELSRSCPQIYLISSYGEALVKHLIPILQSWVDPRHWKVFLRHVLMTQANSIPFALGDTVPCEWFLELCQHVIIQMFQIIVPYWAKLMPDSVTNTSNFKVQFQQIISNGQVGASIKQKLQQNEDEVVTDTLMRELTREFATFLQRFTQEFKHMRTDHLMKFKLKSMQKRGSFTNLSLSDNGSQEQDDNSNNNNNSNNPNTVFGQDQKDIESLSFLKQILTLKGAYQQDRSQVALGCLELIIKGVTWPDSESVRKFSSVARYYVNLNFEKGKFVNLNTMSQIQQQVCRQLLVASLEGFTAAQQPKNEFIQAELVSLLRLILVKFCKKDPQMVQTIGQFYGLLQYDDVTKFLEKITQTGSEKTQKLHVKQFLLSKYIEQ